MDTGDAQVVERSCVETIRTSVEGVLGQEGDDPPEGHQTLDDGKSVRDGSRLNTLQ